MSSSLTSRYIIQSSDVISDMRINVRREGSEQVVWYKERFLSDTEIVEHVIDSPTSTICWTIHKPKRGWYIRLRAPTFPPNIYIALLPVARAPDSVYSPAALTFSCRTNLPISESTSAGTSRNTPGNSAKSSFESNATLTNSEPVHSYPPTPPAHSGTTITKPPSPGEVAAKLSGISNRQPQSHVTSFILDPLVGVNPVREDSSFFSRALSVLRNHQPIPSSSFTLSQTTVSVQAQRMTPHDASTPTPLLTFHDRTPLFTVRSVTGLLEIDKSAEQKLGIQTSFWIAVALTYLEFLEDRDSYLAALND